MSGWVAKVTATRQKMPCPRILLLSNLCEVRRLPSLGGEFMVVITCIVAAAVILAVVLLFYLANGARSRDGGGNPFKNRKVKPNPEQRGTGIN